MKLSKLGRAVLAGVVLMGASVAWSEPVPPAQVSSAELRAEALQAEALKAIRQGEWTRTSELISKAAQVSSDPTLSKMSQWIAQFETQRQSFAAERNKQYEEAVADVRRLIEAGHEGFAIDAAARAYILAEDKQVFHDQDWVIDLIGQTISLADRAEQAHEWVRALRLYGDLAAIEPLNPRWKSHIKQVTRRIRALAMYNPEALRDLSEAEATRREAADAVLKPTTQPTTRPVAETNDAFRIDWKEQVKGIQTEMLRDALRDARRHYWRSVTYKDLLGGGVEGLRALATTPGVEKAFPKLADENARERFIRALDDMTVVIDSAPSPNDDSLMTRTLSQLWQRNRESIDLPEEVFANEFADGAFSKLDEFTGMIWPFDVEEFNKSTQGEFVGVGIHIDTNDIGELLVVSPLEDTPAYKLGIKAGDVITHINGKNAKGITISQAVKNITGQPGTTVRLTVRSPDGESRTYDIKRETIKVASVKGWQRKSGGSGSWDYLIDPDQGIGYIRMTNFTKSTTDELRSALTQLRRDQARAIILDLRYNPGGLLNAATEVTDRFLSGGDIVSTRSERERSGPPPIVARADADDVFLPMVVLVNQFSASASEIVSGALRDHKRALIVGERTFGKGSVQMLFQVDGKAAFLKLTTSHYYLPGGECIHRDDNSPSWGVEPDITVTMTNEQMVKANRARREQDVLRDEAAPATQPAVAAGDVLDVDPQLSAAVLLLRLQLAGAKI